MPTLGNEARIRDKRVASIVCDSPSEHASFCSYPRGLTQDLVIWSLERGVQYPQFLKQDLSNCCDPQKIGAIIEYSHITRTGEQISLELSACLDCLPLSAFHPPTASCGKVSWLVFNCHSSTACASGIQLHCLGRRLLATLCCCAFFFF